MVCKVELEKSGTAHLLLNGSDIGDVTYHLIVFTNGRVRDGRGTLSGDMDLMERCFESSDVSLVIGGARFNIILDNLNSGASFVTDGEIPLDELRAA